MRCLHFLGLRTVALLRFGLQVIFRSLGILSGSVLTKFRTAGESLIGKRAYRVLFASASLPLAVSTVMYFINHRYSGVPLWQLQGLPGLHTFVWIVSFASFFFLYPSTFNLLEVCKSNFVSLYNAKALPMSLLCHNSDRLQPLTLQSCIYGKPELSASLDTLRW